MASSQRCYGCNMDLVCLSGTSGASAQAAMADFQCVFCRKRFHGRCALSTAAASSHLQMGFICTFGCLQAFEAGRQQRKVTETACLECGKTFARPGNMLEHVQRVHRKERHGPCVCCTPAETFATRQALIRHTRRRQKKVAGALLLLE